MMARSGKTRIYTGKTFVEAVTKARQDLGEDISIVQRRDVREKKHLFSILNRGKLGGDSLSVELEVAVAREGAAMKRKAASALPPEPVLEALPAANPLLRTYAKALEGAERHSPAAREAMAAAAEPYLTIGETSKGIAQFMDDVKKTLERTNRENADLRDEMRMLISLQARGWVPAVEPELLEFYRLLVDHDVRDDLARDIVEDLQRELSGAGEDRDLPPLLREAVARRIPVSGPILLREDGPTVVALVGSSGVGKTTSIVKLAIHYAMRRGKTVGVINEDLRRPGAEVQINNVGRLVGAAVTSASGPRAIAEAVRSFSGRDLVLVDTAGRSPRDGKGIACLAEILGEAGVHETHLLLAAGSSEKMLEETAARYHPTGFDRFILTKLDESVSHGPILNVGTRLAHGFSYMTTGADYNLPIAAADRDFLADLILGRTTVDADCPDEAMEGDVR